MLSLKSLALTTSLFAALYGCSISNSSTTTDSGLGGAATGGTGALTGGSTGTGGAGTGSSGTGGEITKPSSRVVGYLPTWRSLDPTYLDLDTLTHICIAFANPDGASSVTLDATDEEINTLVSAAHEKGVKVLISIAGAAGGEDVVAEITGDMNGYIADLVAFVNKYSFDGIDVDIEGSNVQANYEPFVKALNAALPADKLLTAALATWNGDDFSDGALAEYDFVNLMAYDHCGTWTSACEHSKYSELLEEIDYWENDRGIPADKFVLGVPFYGYCWGAGCPATTLTYADILWQFPDGKTSDYLQGADYTISHNSPATIAMKAELAKNHGGIMIWELGQDATGDDALFAVIKSKQ